MDFILCAGHACQADGLQDALPPNQREGNLKARASLVTVMFGGSRRGSVEHSVSKPKLANRVGNLAGYGKALKLDNSI